MGSEAPGCVTPAAHSPFAAAFADFLLLGEIASAGDGQNGLFLTPDNILPPASLTWALLLSVWCDGGRREGVGGCRCAAAPRWMDV